MRCCCFESTSDAADIAAFRGMWAALSRTQRSKAWAMLFQELYPSPLKIVWFKIQLCSKYNSALSFLRNYDCAPLWSVHICWFSWRNWGGEDGGPVVVQEGDAIAVQVPFCQESEKNIWVSLRRVSRLSRLSKQKSRCREKGPWRTSTLSQQRNAAGIASIPRRTRREETSQRRSVTFPAFLYDGISLCFRMFQKEQQEK